MTSELRLLHWPEEDRASFAQFTSIMTDVQARIQAISGEAGGVPVPIPPRVPTPRECAAMILRHRRDVRAMAGLDGDLFGDPAWEIMLAIFVAEPPRDDAAVLVAVGLPVSGTVGNRWIRVLIDRGWVARTGEGWLCATPKSEAILTGYFQRL